MDSNLVLLFTIDLGQGNTADLPVYNDSKIEDLAKDFCQTHQLTERTQESLKLYIYKQIQHLKPLRKSKPYSSSEFEGFIAKNKSHSRKYSERPPTHSKRPSADNREKHIHEKRVELLKAEMALCTFSPSINKFSRKMDTSKRNGSKRCIHLYKDAKKRDVKMKKKNVDT